MTEGQITLSLESAPDRAGRSDMVARLEPIGTASDRVAVDLILPAGAREGRTITVETGFYNVQLFLPAGGVVQKVCEVAAGQNVPVVLEEIDATASRFSLQEATGPASLGALLDQAVRSRAVDTSPIRGGSVRATTAREPGSEQARRGAKGRKPAATKVQASRKPAGVRSVKGTGLMVAGAPRRMPTVEVESGRRPRALRGSVRAAAPSGPAMWLAPSAGLSGVATWRRLADVDGVWLREAAGSTLYPPLHARDGAAVWRIDGSVAAQLDLTSRLWAVVDSASGLEVVSLPAPWRSIADGMVSPIDVLTDAKVTGRAATSVAIHDQRLDGLLSYLDQGRISAVRPLVEQLDHAGLIQHVIMEKAQNPLAACAAAYVGLALFDPDEQERWDSWLPNIMTRFPWIPDGGIVHARRIMLRPRDASESSSVMAALTSAFQAGVPYYSAGLQLLREMLERLAVNRPEAAAMLSDVAPVAARADPRQLFTTLRYPARPRA